MRKLRLTLHSIYVISTERAKWLNLTDMLLDIYTKGTKRPGFCSAELYNLGKDHKGLGMIAHSFILGLGSQRQVNFMSSGWSWSTQEISRLGKSIWWEFNSLNYFLNHKGTCQIQTSTYTDKYDINRPKVLPNACTTKNTQAGNNKAVFTLVTWLSIISFFKKNISKTFIWVNLKICSIRWPSENQLTFKCTISSLIYLNLII